MLDNKEEKSRIQTNRDKLASISENSNYQFQLKNRIGSSDLKNYFLLTESEEKGIKETIRLNVSSTPYYILLSDPFDPNCPIRRMIVPTETEIFISQEESADPLNEEDLSPVPGLTCMYPDRALLFANHECSVYCRHCMRGRKVSDNKERMDHEALSKCFDYLRSHPEITDVVVSGGDPLNLSDSKIDWILGELESIESVQICRLGTRNPVTNPMRITKELCEIIEKRNSDQLSIFCNTQFNHPKECTKDAEDAILRILKAGVSVGNQTVILKGINDSGEVMLELHKKLLKMRVRAYYMYDPEILPGSRGFRTPLHKGIEIIEYMRGKISGMGIPHFVNDLPGGGGKITLSPNWYLGYHKESKRHLFRSAAHGTYHLSPEPLDSEYENSYQEVDIRLWNEVSPTARHVNSKSKNK
ncbi:KamA family radical SAM protein [Leptospira sp. GIMC2001]|nr:KamA family radical SAM protein [Leptospira sp. GIMC2001]WCL47952.1 KamA family radical SAM protein [Leptospira sp. GIMC2001]